MPIRWLIPVLCCPAVLVAAASRGPADDPPEDAERHRRQGAAWYAKGDLDRAIKELDEAVRLAPAYAMAYSGRGAVRFARKEYDKAIEDLDRAIKLGPGKPSSGYYIRGAAWYMKGDYAKAVRDLDRAIELDPKETEALNSRAWAAAVCPDAKYRDAKLALEYAEQACELDGRKNPFYLGTLAAAYAANGRFNEAVKWQRKALEDRAYQKASGDEGRKMLRLFEQGKPYREEPPKKP